MNKLNKLAKEIYTGLKSSPLLTLWQLLWLVPLYTSLLLTSAIVAITNLSVEAGVDFFNDVTR